MKRGLFQLQYELDNVYTEFGSDRGAKLSSRDVDDPTVRRLLEETAGMGYKETVRYLTSQQDGETGDIVIVPITTRTPQALDYRLEGHHPKLIYLARPLHTIEHLNDFLYTANKHLDEGAYLCCHSMTAALKHILVEKRYPWGIRHVVIAWNYLWHRICPKLKITHRLYFTLTEGKNRTMSRVEIIGRLYRAGFDVVDERFREGEFFLTARKMQAPIADTPPSGSPIIHLRRVGKGGKEIVVHKFRTMYTYSEYVQPYIYHYQSLERGGKFKDDYRINFWGRTLRRLWIDELPMVWNLLRGDIKLVGVRPLSHHYYSLYSPELQTLRIRTKPGLLPPFYYENHTPETLEEVQESERRYLESYLAHPFRTDWHYFWGIIGNILFNKKRSK